MLGCLLLSGIASKGGLKHLHVEVEVRAVDEAWAGKPADGTLRVRNASRIWNVRDVVFVSPELADPVLVPILPRRQELVIPVQFLFHRRGLAELKTLDSYTRYPFGFFLKKRRLRVHSEVVVYPRLHPESLVREQFRSVRGQETSEPRPGEGTEIHSFREYARGDSLRHVHWKKSASLGRWIMKQNEAEGMHAVQVVVDPYIEPRRRFERRVRGDDQRRGDVHLRRHGARPRGHAYVAARRRPRARGSLPRAGAARAGVRAGGDARRPQRRLLFCSRRSS